MKYKLQKLECGCKKRIDFDEPLVHCETHNEIEVNIYFGKWKKYASKQELCKYRKSVKKQKIKDKINSFTHKKFTCSILGIR